MKEDAISVLQMKTLKQGLGNWPPNHTAGKMMSLQYAQAHPNPELLAVNSRCTVVGVESTVWAWLRGDASLLVWNPDPALGDSRSETGKNGGGYGVAGQEMASLCSSLSWGRQALGYERGLGTWVESRL